MLGRELIKIDNKHGVPSVEIDDGLKIEVIMKFI
jgi:hypothetical protein